MEDCQGKAFKMVSMLLYELPMDKTYKVIFMKRNMEEMLKSQKVMLQRLKRKDADVGDEQMLEKLKKHLRHVENWLEGKSNIEVIYLSYNALLEKPAEITRTVCQFLGNYLNAEKMAGVVDQADRCGLAAAGLGCTNNLTCFYPDLRL